MKLDRHEARGVGVGGKREELCDARRVAHLAKGGASAVSDD
jgi:hypothetical protein